MKASSSRRNSTLSFVVAGALLTAPGAVNATDTDKKPAAAKLPAVQLQTNSSLKGSQPTATIPKAPTNTLPAQPGGAMSNSGSTSAAPSTNRPGLGGNTDRMRQANQMRDAQQMGQMNGMREGVQGASAMPGGGQHRSGSGMPGVPGAGQSGGRLPGVSAAGQEGGAHTGGGSRSGGAHTGGGAPYLPGFEPRGTTTGGGGAHTGGTAGDPFVRDASGNPISQPATRTIGGEDNKKNTNGGGYAGQPVNNTNARSNTNADKPKEEKPKEEKPSYEKQDKPAKEKEPAGKEPKEKTEKSTVMPREDDAGGGAPRMTSRQQGNGPGAREGSGSGTTQGPRVRVGGTDVNPQADAPRGGFAPRGRDQMGGAGPGARPGQGALGMGDPD